MGFEREKQLADDVLRSMAGLDAGALRVLSSSLRIGGPPLSRFAAAFGYHADALEDRALGRPRPARSLATLAMASALHRGAFVSAELLERLERAGDEQPWAALRDAVAEVAALRR